MKTPKIAVVSFPGNNCEVESLRALKNSGIEAIFFKWNDDKSKLADVDGYFIPGGFSYEDRGRAGMVAGRDPLLDFIGQEAEAGKVVIGNCNGAQILVESGLVPLGNELQMCLARNVVRGSATGFLSEWVWVKPSCAPDRCATANWTTPMHMPIAHGEGRFTTEDKDLLTELQNTNQLAFQYCNEAGEVSEDPIVTPNGAVYAVAGICNPTGNVVALMPHPERTPNGQPYFESLRKWIETKGRTPYAGTALSASTTLDLPEQEPADVEIFIDTIITNNEERTVEQAAHRVLPNLRLKQLRYMAPKSAKPDELLRRISLFNPNKEVAYVRQQGVMYKWDADAKKLEKAESHPITGEVLLRVDDPDTGSTSIGGGVTGVCYVCTNCSKDDLRKPKSVEIFANLHASSLVFLA